MPTDRVASLVSLAESNPDHLMTFVRANDRIFLNPQLVKDVTLPLQQQLANYLHRPCLTSDTLDEVERALRTGVVEGTASDSDDDDDDGAFLDECWRSDTFEAWATTLRASASGAAGGCVLTTDGRCVGPVPVRAWLDEHIPPALAALKRVLQAAQGGEEGPPAPNVAISQAQQLASHLAVRIEEELRLSSSSARHLRKLLPQLVLVLDCIGELPDAWLVAESRNAAMGSAYAGARALAAACRERRAAAGSFMVLNADDGADDSEVEEAEDDAAALLAELRCVGFVAARLVEQDARLVREQAARDAELGIHSVGGLPLGGDDDGWSGDEEGPEQHAAALLELTVHDDDAPLG